MKHWPLKNYYSAHYAASVNCLDNQILIQLQDEEGTQVRLQLELEEALHLIDLLQEGVESIRSE